MSNSYTHPWPDGGDRELDDPNRDEDDEEPEPEDPMPCLLCRELRVRGLYEVCRECSVWHLPMEIIFFDVGECEDHYVVEADVTKPRRR